ncbi:MAG TPA: response regulator [Thermoanaerobaculia bacterium]|nr:response regulator [Thermoanaerobaculia bacterium]
MSLAEGLPTNILIVDDRPEIRESLGSLVQSESPLFTVATAASGIEALEHLRIVSADVVLCDLKLKGGMDGIEVTRRIKNSYPSARVIVFTGKDVQEDTKSQVRQAGAFSYLSKPINFDELLHGIATINSIRTTEYLVRCFEALSRIAYSLQETFDLDALAHRIVNGACELGFQRARLYLFDEARRTLIGKAHQGELGLNFEGYEIPLDSSPIITHIFEHDRPTVWTGEDIRKEFGDQIGEPWLTDMDLHGIPWIDVALVVGNKRIGTLAVDHHGSPEGLYTREDLRITEIFAGLAAQSLNNGRLYQEQALANAFLGSILREAPDAVVSTDIHGVIKQASPSIEGVTGHPPERMVGRSAAEFYTDEKGSPEVGRIIARDLMEEVRTHGRITNRRVCLFGLDFLPRPISVSLSLLHDDQKHEIGTLGILKDLGPFEAQTRRYRDLLEGFGYGTILLDRRGIMEYCNGKAERLLHRPLDGALGKPFLAMISEPQRDEFERSFKTVLREGVEHGLDLDLLRPDGLPVPIKGFLTPFRSDGAVKGVAVALYGLAELASLDRSGRLMALGQMVATLPHEINNALNNLLPSSRDLATYLAKASAPSERVRFYLDVITRNAERIQKIVRQIREFARPREFQREQVGINDVIKEAADFLQATLRDIRLVLDLDLALPEVLGEPTRLQQVFVNLMTNAKEAMEGQDEPREIRIQSRLQGASSLVVTVTDSGSGIPQEAREFLFDPFFTLKTGSGTGLGLFIVKSIMDLHGGTIEVLDRPREEGTCFKLTFKLYSSV